jgi:hypothetical protein
MTAELGDGEVAQVLEWVGLSGEPIVAVPEMDEEAAIPAKLPLKSAPSKPRTAHARGPARHGQFSHTKSKTGVKR